MQTVPPPAPDRSRRYPVGRLSCFLILSVMVAGCGEALAPERFSGTAPEMRPERFFAGETRSSGVLETAAGAPSERFTVQGHGYVLTDGGFRLDQTVAFAAKPVRLRSWIIRRVDDHRYSATLTDASGSVTAQAYGDLFHLTYPLKGAPLGRMEQWLYLQPDGCTVMNEAVVRVAGFAVRRLSERISNVSGSCPKAESNAAWATMRSGGCSSCAPQTAW